MSDGDGAGALGELPRSPRMRYWQPAADLRPFISGYHLYAVDPEAEGLQRDVFQPAGPILRITFGPGGSWRVRPPRGEWTVVPRVALFGPTDGITWSESGGGITVGFGILARGWARLSGVPAASWANRVGTPGAAFRLHLPGLVAELAAARDDEAIPAIFDQVLASALDRAAPYEDTIAAFERALLTGEAHTVAALAEQIGRPVRSTERLALRAFGFPPKKLIRRARFLRSLHALADAQPSERSAAIAFGYTDYSHFIRDAHTFLGMSPRAFLKLDNPLLKQSLALRKAVLGAPAQALAVTRA